MDKKKILDNRNTKLYESIKSKYIFNFKKSSNDFWGSDLKEGKVFIGHSKTAYPIASFTHELLHIDTQMKGYRRIRGGICLDKTVNQWLERILTSIDNEFQHHKMFLEFSKLGFKKEEFYHDNDSKIIDRLEEILSQPNQPLHDIVIDYLSLIAPGGKIPYSVFCNLQQEFYLYEGSKYAINFKKIDNIMQRWTNDTSFDAESYIIEFLDNLQTKPLWITYNTGSKHMEIFPNDGFFVGSLFTLDDISSALL